jgi:streptogramin lyase
MKRRLTLIALAAAAALIGPVGPAVGSDKDREGAQYDKVTGGLTTPLHLAVGSNKSVYVTQDFAGKISRIDRHAGVDDVYQAPEGFGVAGVETRGATTFFLETAGAGDLNPANLKGYLKAINPNGKVRLIADLAEHERKNNPDGHQQYGFGPDVSDQCLEGWPEYPPARYKGALDSNAYATAVQGNTAYVADAGANAILKVNIHSGEVSTLAVLPPRPAVVPKNLVVPLDMAGKTFEVPDCVEGREYAFEPVPTDVEFGPDGWLYVTSLPGGPEIPELGHRGAVFKVNPWTGQTKLWVEHILSPTGLAVANNGDVYVASLFGNEILKFHAWKGHRTPFLKVNQPADVEIQGRALYATENSLSGAPAGPETPAAAAPAKPDGRVIKADLR